MDSEEETRKRLRLLEQLHKLHVMELKREASRLQPISAQLSSSPKRVRGDLMVLLGQVGKPPACCRLLYYSKLPGTKCSPCHAIGILSV
jgi:hypothetical protein